MSHKVDDVTCRYNVMLDYKHTRFKHY